MNVPSELNACARLSRLEAVAAGPITVTYGLTATWTTVMPAARMMSAERKTPKTASFAAGMKPAAPTAITIKPNTMVFL